MFAQTALYRLGDTSSMHPHFHLIPYALPTQLADTRNALDRFEVLGDDGITWVPAYPPSADELTAIDAVEARIAGHSLHNFEPLLQGGHAILIDLAPGWELANGLGPDKFKFHTLFHELLDFITKCPQRVALLQPLEMAVSPDTREPPTPVQWDDMFRRDPERQIVIWARTRSITRGELYSLIYHGLRDRYLTQVRSGNLILIAPCQPYTAPTWFKSSSNKTKGSFGRGRQPSPGRDSTATTAPAPPPSDGRGFAPGRDKVDKLAGAPSAPKSTRRARTAKTAPAAAVVVPKPPPAPDP